MTLNDPVYIEAAQGLGHKHHVGITATAPGFYGAQGRPIPRLPIRYPDLADEMTRQRVMNFEMEASALLVLSRSAEAASPYAIKVEPGDATVPKGIDQTIKARLTAAPKGQSRL